MCFFFLLVVIVIAVVVVVYAVVAVVLYLFIFFAILGAFWYEKRNWDTLYKKCLTGECVVCLCAEQIFAIMSYYTAAHLYCFLMMASMRFLHINGVHRTKVLFLNIFFVFSLFLLSFPIYLPHSLPLCHSIFAKLQKEQWNKYEKRTSRINASVQNIAQRLW